MAPPRSPHFGSQKVIAKATVTDYSDERPVSFRNQVVPILTKNACNSGGCHGKQLGQNNFKLSLLGFDTDFDSTLLSRKLAADASCRRRRTIASCSSKPSARSPTAAAGAWSPIPHEYELLRRWILQAPQGSDQDPRVTRIECLPKARVVGLNAKQQLLVTAFYTDGTSRDVTAEAQFKSKRDQPGGRR